jgi:acyl carrier protein
MAAPKTIEDKVRAILCELLGVTESEASMNALLAEDLGADELDLVEITMALEEEFRIEIPDDEADALYGLDEAARVPHVADVVQFVQKKVGKVASA